MIRSAPFLAAVLLGALGACGAAGGDGPEGEGEVPGDPPGPPADDDSSSKDGGGGGGPDDDSSSPDDEHDDTEPGDEGGVLDVDAADAVILGQVDGDEFGTSIAGGGDVDGDLRADVLVGAPGIDLGGEPATGGAFVFRGPVLGSLDAGDAGVRIDGAYSDEDLGGYVTFIGDADGNDLDDFVVVEADPQFGAHVYFSPLPAILGAFEDDGNLSGGRVSGPGVFRLGDLDGNGSSDFALGISDGPPYEIGRVLVFLGPFYIWVGPDYVSAERWESSGGTGFGTAVAAGDLDGDGHRDLVVSAPSDGTGGEDAGAVYLWRGPIDGFRSMSAGSPRLFGFIPGDRAGATLAVADVDRDGQEDVLVGAPQDGGGGSCAGRVYVVFGPWDCDPSLASADAVIEGSDGDRLGTALDTSGDFDGDGAKDLLVGGEGAGAGWLLTHALPAGTSTTADLDVWFQGPPRADGSTVTFLGDTDGDGRDDVGLGAPSASEAGAVYVFLGREAAPP